MVFIPLACFLVTAWEAFARQYEKDIWDLPVEFSFVKVYQPVSVNRGDKVQLDVAWDFSGHWQIVYEGNLIAEGNLKVYDVETQLPKELEVNPSCKQLEKPSQEWLGVDPEAYDHINRDQWYAICLRQSLQYGPKFQMVSKYAVDRTWCELRWDQNWIIHLDGVFQREDRGADYHVHTAKGMRRLVICDTLKDEPAGYEERLESDTYLKYTRGRSVIVQNYQDEIATQKKKAAKTLVHKLEFQPLGVRTETDDKRTAYTQKLMSLAKTLFKKLKGDDKTLLQMKSVLEKLPGKVMGASAMETFTTDENNLLAGIFADAYDEEEGPSVNVVAEHSGLGKAESEDLFLNGFSQGLFDVVLGLAVSNMKAAGYSVAEIGAGSGAFTKKALQSFISIPQSALVSYTATDKEATSDIAKTVPHNSLGYKAWDLNKGSASPGQYNIIVANNLSATAQDLPSVLDALYANTLEGGFIFLQETVGALGAAIFGYDQGAWQHTDGRAFGPVTSIEHWQELLTNAGFKEVQIVKDTLGASALFLFRKLEVPPTNCVLVEAPRLNATEEEMDAWLKNYLDALNSVDPVGKEEAGTVWLYGDEVQNSGILGFLTSARKEYKGDRVRAVILWGEEHEEPYDYEALVQRCLGLDLIGNVFKDDAHGSYAPAQTQYKSLKNEEECPSGGHLNFEVYGNLRSAIWRENQPVPPVADAKDLIRCNVAFGALNFRDVMLAYGKLSKQQMAHESGGDNIGFEFSGTEEGTGRRLMGSAKNAMATKVVTRPNLIWEVPEHWSLAEAATVPTAYMTAYYALVMRGRLKKGHRVLIHSATGAVGLAATQICLARGAEVFVTVGSAEKRKFLLRTFPGLQEDHIGDSRSLSFEMTVKNVTRGKGVHLLLNSLAGDKLQASVRCLGHWGKLLEIGKVDILDGTPLSMRPMLNNISFEGVDVDRVMNHPESTELAALNALVTEGLKTGEVRPLPVTVFNRTETEEAFRFLAGGTHIGKVMVDVTANPKPQETNNCLGAKPSKGPSKGQPEVTLPALKLQPAVYFDPQKSYIVTGGLGGFGLAVCEFLNAYGAKNIVVTSKRGVRDGNQTTHLLELFKHNINFRVTTLDVGVAEEAEQIVKLAETLAPVGGVFHLAMYLADKLITNQTGESWNKVMHAKAKGAYNMSHATKNCKQLDHFVMWSSFVASAGNEGQCNYGYANACLDVLSEQRKRRGLPSLSIQWGVIDHVGVADKNIQDLMASGLLGASMAQPIDDCLKTLGQLMNAGPKQAPVMSSSWQPTNLLGKSSGGDSKNILGSVLTVMGLSPNEVSDADTLSRLGIDSMQLVEVRGNLQRALGRPLALDEASAMSIGEIKAMESGGDAPAPAPAADATADDSSPPSSAEPLKAAPVIRPCKIINLAKDLPVRKEVGGRIAKDYTPKIIKPDVPVTPERAYSPPSGPSTPDRDEESPRSPRVDLSSASLNSIKAHTFVSRSVSPSPVARQTVPAVVPPKRTAQSPKPTAMAPPATSSSGAVGERQLDALATPGTDSEHPFTWEDYTNGGFATQLSMLVLVWGWAISTLGMASKFGLVFSIPVIMLSYLAAGFGFTLVTVAMKRFWMPTIRFDTPIKLFSPQFGSWWLVHRFVEINNLLFIRNFRGTIILNYYYVLMGAKIAENAFVDTLDVMDFDSLEIGEGASIGEGCTIVGHIFDNNGDLVLKKVSIGENVRVSPYSVIAPDTKIKAGEELKPLAKSTTPISDLSRAQGLSAAFKNTIASPELSPLDATLYQIAGLVVPMLVSILAAFVGCATYEKLMSILGTPVDIRGAYAPTALVTLSNPFLAIVALLFAPVNGLSLKLAASYIPACLTSFLAAPAAFLAFALSLVIGAGFAKSLVIGNIAPGVHKRASKYGVAFWVSQRLVDICFNNVGLVLMGTWAWNSIYSLFGASIGAFTVLRKSPAVTVPDMLKLGKWVVGGDISKIATCMSVNNTTIVSAPVVVGDQGTIGAGAVLLPGTTVPSQATIAPLAVPEPGSSLNPKTVYMGSPAFPVKEDLRGDAGVEIPVPLQAVALALPYFQLVACMVVAVASHLPAAALGLFAKSLCGGPLGQYIATLFAFTVQSLLMGRLSNRLQGFVGKVSPGPGPRQFDINYFIACTNAAITFYCANFGDALWKGSPSWVRALRKSGISIGKWCYLDNEWVGEPGVAVYGDRAIADRGAIVFGHLMTHNGKEFAMQYNTVSVGSGAVVNARAALMPGITVSPGEQVPAGELRISI